MSGPPERESSGTITVCIVDDHQMVRDGLQAVFAEADDIEVVGEADSVASALAVVRRLRPQVALIDIRLPDGTGIDICRAVRDEELGVQCLVLTSIPDDEALFEAVRAGAAGYVLKQIRSEELLSCLRRVAAGESLVDARSARRLRERAEHRDADPLLDSLSDQERRLLDLLAQGMTNREIAAEMYLAEKTVKNYVSNLLMKMGVARRSEAAAHAARIEERRRQMGPADVHDPVRF